MYQNIAKLLTHPSIYIYIYIYIYIWGKMSDWHKISQISISALQHLTCLATLKSCDTTKHLSVDDNIYICLCCTFIYAAFKSHTEWSNAQQVSIPTTTIQPTTVCTCHALKCFSHMIFLWQTNTYQNIAELLTHSSKKRKRRKANNEIWKTMKI